MIKEIIDFILTMIMVFIPLITTTIMSQILGLSLNMFMASTIISYFIMVLLYLMDIHRNICTMRKYDKE